MAKYTVEVVAIVNNLTLDSVDKNIYERIDLACPKIFDFAFPCWNEGYKLTIERKIISKYLMKEIGLETVALWKFYLYERLNSIMPYYNQLYETTVVDYDYKKDHLETETINNAKGTISDTTGTNTKGTILDTTGTDTKGTVLDTTNNNTVNLTNESNGGGSNTKGTLNTITDAKTPQSRIGNAGTYASNISENQWSGTDTDTNNNTTTNTGTNNTTGKATNSGSDSIVGRIVNSGSDSVVSKVVNSGSDVLTRNVSGSNAPVQDLIVKYREQLLRLDDMIANEFSDLFMMVY